MCKDIPKITRFFDNIPIICCYTIYYMKEGIVMDLLLYMIAFMVVMIAQMQVTGAYQKYRNVPSERGVTGAQVARRILDMNGLHHIGLEITSGTLGDHYDPSKKVVRLSHDVFYGSSIASVAVAAHEVGHAIQHKENYGFIALRNSILPICSFANSLAWPVLFIGLFFAMEPLLYIGIIMLVAVLVFQVITLPVEFNASSRALKILSSEGIIYEEEVSDAKSMLSAAAMTYVAAVVSSALQIMRFLLIANRRRD